MNNEIPQLIFTSVTFCLLTTMFYDLDELGRSPKPDLVYPKWIWKMLGYTNKGLYK